MKRHLVLATGVALAVILGMAAGADAALYDAHNLTADVSAVGGWPVASPSVGEWSCGSSQAIGSFTPFDQYLGFGLTVWHTPAYAGNPYNANTQAPTLTPHSYYMNGAVGMAADHRISGSDNVLDAGEEYVDYTIIRWTAPTAMQITINATFDTLANGSVQPTDAWIAKGTNVLFSQTATNPETTISSGVLNATVLAGESIDFLIKRNVVANGDNAALSNLDVTITEVPEPMTLALLAMGGVATLRRRV